MAFPLEHHNQTDLKCLKTNEKTTSHHIFPKARVKKMFVSYLVSFVPICCLSSSLSSSVCMGRMFFSSSSLLEGLLLSLIAKESFLHSFLARGPVGKRKGSAKGGVIISLQHAAGKEVLAKGGYGALLYTGMDYGKRGVINFMCSINLNSHHNKEKLKLVGIQEIELIYCSIEGNGEEGLVSELIVAYVAFSSTVFPHNGMKNSTSESGQAAELQHVKREGYQNVSCNVISRHPSQH